MATIKAVIFDVGGVILPSPLGAFTAFEKERNLPVGFLSRSIMKAGDNGPWQKLETGEYSLHQFIQVFNKEYTEKLGTHVDVSDLFLSMSQHLSKPYPQILDAVLCLKAEGIKTAIITNNWKLPGQEDSVGVIDRSMFDVVIESCQVGLRKPDPKIYQLCITELGVEPQECVYLDDLGVNLKPAREMGVRTIKVTDPDQAVKDLEKAVDGLCLRCYKKGTTTVPKHLQIPINNLWEYLNNVLHTQSKDPPVVRCFGHGQSNPTYYINHGGRDLVLRKKPPGKLLPSAHAVDREYTVMKAVRQHGVPTPEMYRLCEDPKVVGTTFFVMEYLDGRVFQDVLLSDMTVRERKEIYAAMIDVLCKIHQVNISRAGLDNYGKKGGYLKRNFIRWSKQYQASKTCEIEAMNHLMDWLPKHMPKDERVSVVHGDFRLDNMVFHQQRPEVIGVLDWELSTIGDPIVDLVQVCLQYYVPGNHPMSLNMPDDELKALGIPTAEEITNEYCQRMGIPPISNWDFYVAFTLFKFAAILQGVYKRAISGQGSAPNAVYVGEFAVKMAEEGWKIASRSNIQPTMVTTSSGNQNTADQMPVTADALSPRAKELYYRVKKFIQEEVRPRQNELMEYYKDEKNKWNICPIQEQLKAKAKAQGLWNLFLPKESDPDGKYGAGLTNVEYAFLCEEMGKCVFAPEVFNCSAPDTGNMETLVKYGTEEQKRKWLIPLLNGEIRSCFAMTEPNVASSDATNIQSSISRVGNHYVLNGHKWWISGAYDPRCKLCIFMGKTDTSAAKHQQQSMILVSMDTPGIKLIRPLPVFGYIDNPHGHAEMIFENVEVPLENMLLGEGQGFRIAQGRLGPGRIHHCMRLLGNAEEALRLMLERSKTRVAFGKQLATQGTVQMDIAKSRIEIEQARLLVLKAAHVMDNYGNKVAAPEISMIKVAAPNAALRVIDRAIQVHGGAGVSNDFPLAVLYSHARTLRIADGPDEVHCRAIAKMEYMKSRL